jgi:hypothetical protein
MTARVCYRPAGKNVAIAFEELGHDGGGAWGIVDDAAWIATPGAVVLELLYVSRAEYEHAMRRLPPAEVALAIQHRRKTFWRRFDQEALGLVQRAIRDAINRAGDDGAGLRLRGRLLGVHARFVDLDRLRESDVAGRIHVLIQGDATLVAELDSPSMKAIARQDVDGKERALRRQMAKSLSAFLRGEGGDAHPFWPHVGVERVYAQSPGHPAERTRLFGEDGPRVRWHDRMLSVLPEGQAEELRRASRQLKPVYGSRGELLAANYLLTPAQLDVEIGERIAAPSFTERLQSTRIAQASKREAARMLCDDDAKLAALLAQQVGEEVRQLGAWGQQPRGPAEGKQALANAVSLASLLAGLLVQRKLIADAAELRALGEALKKAAEEP